MYTDKALSLWQSYIDAAQAAAKAGRYNDAALHARAAAYVMERMADRAGSHE